MTRSDAELDFGGTGSVLAIWSILIVVIGAALFGYSLVVTIRGRNRRRKRRTGANPHGAGQHGQGPHGPTQHGPAQHGPTQHGPGQHGQTQHGPAQHVPMQHQQGPSQHGGGQRQHPGPHQPHPGGQAGAGRPMPPPPASRPMALPSGPTAGGVPVGRHLGLPRPPAALPPGPHSRPLALPGQPTQRVPSAPPPVGLPSAGSPPALPPGAGTTGAGNPAANPNATNPNLTNPNAVNPNAASTTYGGTTYGATNPGIGAGPTTYAAGAQGPTTYGATDYGVPEATATPVSSVPGLYGAPAAIGPGDDRTVRVPPPPGDRKSAKPPKRGRPDPCAALRGECEQLRALAATAAAAAAQAATDAESAHADFVTAQREADEARRALEETVREAIEVANQVAQLERVPTDAQEQLQAETSHAAFAAYRRGDITAEQLREVFKRAEGWTPEHDRLSRRSNELRAQETELTRIRDAAIMAEQLAGDRARTSAITARNLDEQARTATVDARGRCAAADACEQRNRRR